MEDEAARMKALPFGLVDVFATEPLTGNPLAVVQTSDLPLATMQRIAREFNQSETTFILAPQTQDADWRLRSFTPTGAEVFGAGHNALGAWWWLAERGHVRNSATTGSFSQEIGTHVLPVEIEFAPGGHPLWVTMTQSEAVPGSIPDDLGRLAEALGLKPNDFVVSRLPIQVVSTGAAHLLVSLNDCDAVDRVRPDPVKLLPVLQSVAGQGCYVFSLSARRPEAQVYSRFFNPTVGIWEDPGTGSAVGPLAFHLAKHGIIQEQEVILVEQGTAMGRTSLIRAWVTNSVVRISGRAVTFAEGTLTVKPIL